VIRLISAVVCQRRQLVQETPIPSIGNQKINGTRRYRISRNDAYIRVARTATAEIAIG
jgi:hypothetical protein